MDRKEILKLIDSLEKTGWNKLEMSEKGFTLKMERGITYAQPVQTVAPTAQESVETVYASAPTVTQATAAVEEVVEDVTAEEAGAIPAGGKDVKSPLVGIFHKQGEIGVGSSLKKGEVVCMIEAMKLMNEVTMPEDGELFFMAADEGDMVEYDQILAKYK